MREPPRVSLWVVIMLSLLAVIVVFDVAFGDDGHGHDHHDATSANTVVGGDSSRVVAVGGGDMDIDDCLATHSIIFGLWQGTHVNALCEAVGMDRDGKYQGAAEMRCSTHKYRKVYGKGQKCIDAVIRTAPPAAVIIESNEEDDDEHQQELDAIYARLSDYEAQATEAKAEARNARVAAQRRPIVNQYGITDEQKAKLQAVLDER